MRTPFIISTRLMLRDGSLLITVSEENKLRMNYRRLRIHGRLYVISGCGVRDNSEQLPLPD